ncbi:MAG TPA: NADH-quinone oxidoreductase subunit J/K, partial [Bacteroidales bacterium]|nr:NADH-quinone oxidoreductase subunit J/K [Bacteroidales bacterium]
MAKYRMHLLVCDGTTCHASQSESVKNALQDCLEVNNLENEVKVVSTGCFGYCEKGPIVKVLPDNTLYVKVKPEDAEEIVKEHILNGQIVKRLLPTESAAEMYASESKTPFFDKKQIRIALRNCGFIDPENIEEYIAHDGYQALCKCLTEYTPQQVIDIIKRSGLRGRGGGGFPTGLKWEITAKVKSDQKYVICNADEGDPGAFMDRSIMEGDPHSVIEAMAINGYCTGANKGLVYIRAEYPLAVKRLKVAIDQARAYGLLGKNIFNSGFDFDIELRYGAGAFVCGEETALIHSMEGKRGEPTFKPPFPSEHGYLGKPSNVNNVETYANVPVIINKGADWFASIGSEKSKGSKVFALAGKINNVGLIEVPMG